MARSRASTASWRDELLNREIFYTLQEAKVLIEQWRKEYNTVRPHSALGYRPPAPEAVLMPQLAPPLVAGFLPDYHLKSWTNSWGLLRRRFRLVQIGAD